MTNDAADSLPRIETNLYYQRNVVNWVASGKEAVIRIGEK